MAWVGVVPPLSLKAPKSGLVLGKSPVPLRWQVASEARLWPRDCHVPKLSHWWSAVLLATMVWSSRMVAPLAPPIPPAVLAPCAMLKAMVL